MILDSRISSSDTKIKDDHKIRNSKIKMLYLGIMYFATNCLSSIALEAGSRSLFRSISTKPVVFNNIFRRNYNLRIKIMIGDLLAALVSTTMLTIGDIYGIPYLYLPWLVNTIEGMIFHEGPALFGLAYTVLPNVNLPTGLFMFITLLLYVEELCIWKDVLINFERCWTRYNKNNKLKKDTKSIRIANKQLCNKAKESLNENIVSPKSTINQQNSATHFHIPNIDDIIKPIKKTIENNTSIKNRRSRSLFTEVTG
ncbi:hypothetical protein ALC56_15261 [Trachymyrmex septentrionalis]|uniref:Uncharacterized protein n=1 Tax=Trachymyrmex septentrionalis TaxID=34720 RepID=A0A195EQL1_9HYME|nr:PREDICTED: uncharacterized protein LOC108756219 [Trachymyrmex septentrionalis]KYN30565.1 hypothetical protein ALC56_15261 [Trachymyrmex septentrionalis]